MAWKPGESGNPAGRPKGVRHKLSEAGLSELVDDWVKHGIEVIQKVREKKPEVYLQVISRLLPQNLELSVDDNRRSISEYSPQELAEMVTTEKPPVH